MKTKSSNMVRPVRRVLAGDLPCIAGMIAWLGAVAVFQPLGGFSAVQPEAREVSSNVLEVGRITHPQIKESSGLAASHTQPDVFWTHTDGGGKKQVLYAITRTGQSLAQYRVSGVMIEDWEDIATDNHGHLFLADIGNNKARRAEIAVHQIDEPTIAKAKEGFVAVTRTWRLRFPAQPFDCESLFVWGESGYVISKVFDDQPASLYRFSITNTEPTQTLQLVAQLKIDSPVTGATISSDGRLLGIVAKNGAYVCRIKGDPAHAADAKLHHAKFHQHIEACTFVPEGLLVTAETRQIYLFTGEEFHPSRHKN